MYCLLSIIKLIIYNIEERLESTRYSPAAEGNNVFPWLQRISLSRKKRNRRLILCMVPYRVESAGGIGGFNQTNQLIHDI